MNQWVQRIEEHALFADMDILQTAIESATPLAEETDTTAVEALDRVLRVFNHLRSSLDLADPIFVQPSWLEEICQNVRQCSGHINQYINSKNIGHLNSANGTADDIIRNSAILWQASSPGVEGNVRKAVSDLSDHCSALTRNLEKKVRDVNGSAEDIRVRLDEFKLDITNQKQRIDTAITSFIQSFNDAETARNADFSKWKDEISSEFTQKKTALERDIDQEIKKATQQFEKLLDTVKQNFEENSSNINGRGTELLDEVTKKKDKAERLVGIIATTGMVSGYQRIANQEGSSFKTWRWITLASMSALIGFSIYAFNQTTSPDFQAGAFANRIFVTATLALLAGYCAFQADRHRRSEMVNRRMELELASFDPFLATLEDDDRNALKKQIADRIFGHFDTNKPVHDGASPANLVDLLKQLISKIPTSTK